jgi:hypothetical protein
MSICSEHNHSLRQVKPAKQSRNIERRIGYFRIRRQPKRSVSCLRRRAHRSTLDERRSNLSAEKSARIRGINGFRSERAPHLSGLRSDCGAGEMQNHLSKRKVPRPSGDELLGILTSTASQMQKVSPALCLLARGDCNSDSGLSVAPGRTVWPASVALSPTVGPSKHRVATHTARTKRLMSTINKMRSDLSNGTS